LLRLLGQRIHLEAEEEPIGLVGEPRDVTELERATGGNSK
jgi:hypothetical protein